MIYTKHNFNSFKLPLFVVSPAVISTLNIYFIRSRVVLVITEKKERYT